MAGFAMSAADPGEIVGLGEASDGLIAGGPDPGIAHQQEVEPGFGGVDDDLGALGRRQQIGQQGAQRRQQARDLGLENRAGGNVDHPVALARIEAEHDIALATDRREVGAAPRAGGDCGQRAHLVGRQAAPGQRLDDEPVFPPRGGLGGEMLQRAAAAGAEMRASVRDAIGRGLDDLGEARAKRAAGLAPSPPPRRRQPHAHPPPGRV